MQNQTKTRHKIVTHQRASRPSLPNAYQISQVALELSREPDGTVDGPSFEKNCVFALRVIVSLQHELEAHFKKSEAQPENPED